MHTIESPVGLRLGIVLRGESTEHLTDVFLGDTVADPAVCSLMGGCGTSVDPTEVSEKSFGFGLTDASLLPHAGWILAVPLRHPLRGQCLFDNTESDLYPADDLRDVERTGEASELDGLLLARQVVDIEKFVSATGRLEMFSGLVFLDAAAVGTSLPALGAGDGVHSLLQIRGDRDEFRQLFGTPVLEPDVNVNAAGGIHGMSLLVQDTDDFNELSDTGFAFENRGNNFNSDVPGFVNSDASVVLGDPAFRQIGDLFACRVIIADSESIAARAGCFDFNAEGKILGDAVGIGSVSLAVGHCSGVRRACWSWSSHTRTPDGISQV